MTVKQEIKQLKKRYDFLNSEYDRYTGSVFYQPGCPREQRYESEMKNISDKLKSYGILY